jgi:hypothetical protein
VTRARRLAQSPATPLETVRKLQTSLQAKAKAEPAFRFYSLWDKVCRADVIAEAYQACRRNGGAAGADGVTFDQITAGGEKHWLEELRQELRAGEYRPQPLLRVWIPKSNGGQRPLGIPCMRGYRAVLPDERATPFLRRVAELVVVAQAIRNQIDPADISALAAQVEALLDENILGVEITAPVREGTDTTGLTDLSAIDFEKLAEAFMKAPRTTVQQLRAKATEAVQKMAAQNPSRVDLIEKLEKLIDAYNAATADVEETFEKLKAFIRSLDVEQGRAAQEGLTEDELTVYDLLTRPEPKLTKAQDVEVKKVARALLTRLHDKVAVFEWHRRQQTRGDVRWTIEEVLNELPEEPYPKDLWDEKVEATWQFVFGHPDWQAGQAARLH